MRKTTLLVSSLVFLALPLFAQTSGAPSHTVIAAAAVKWVDAPPNLPKNAKIAVLYGDPSKEGLFILRLKMPPGYRIAPHWHPSTENVTVISGLAHIAMGDKFDSTKGNRLGAGGFVSLPAEMHHYAWSKTGAVVEIAAMGPFVLNYLNPNDDPSKKK